MKPRIYDEPYRIRHHDEVILYSREYYKKNKEKESVRHKKYYANHIQEISDYRKRYYQEHKQEKLKYNKIWLDKNLDRVLEYRKKRWKETKVIYRVRRLMDKYGITLNDYDSMYIEQIGLCPLCGLALMLGYGDSIDHDHKTMQIRGILHSDCNRTLGMIEKNTNIVSKIQNYLNAGNPAIQIGER